MHAGKTLELLKRMVSATEFTIEDYCRFDSLITGLERDFRESGDTWPMPQVRHKLDSARKYFQAGCGLGDDADASWDRARTFALQDLSAVETAFRELAAYQMSRFKSEDESSEPTE